MVRQILNEEGQKKVQGVKDFMTQKRPTIPELIQNKFGDQTETQQPDASEVPPVAPPQEQQPQDVLAEEQVTQQTDVTTSETPKTPLDSPLAKTAQQMFTPQQQAQQQPVLPEPALPKTATHVVRAGDTISDIAKRFGVNLNDVTGFKSGNPNLIFPGETLTVNKVKTKAPTIPVKKPIEQRMLESQEETPEESNAIVEETFAETGVTPDELSFVVNPYKAFEDTYSQLYETFQVGRLEENIKTMLDDFADVDKQMKEALEKVNENPWTSQSTKSRESQKVADKFNEQKTALTDRITLFENTRDRARDEIRFMSETALNQFNKDREFEQDRLDSIADRAEKTPDQFTLGKDQIRFDEEGNVIARGVGSTLGGGVGGSTGTQLGSSIAEQNIPTFEDFIAQEEEKRQQSLSGESRELLRLEYDQAVADVTSQNAQIEREQRARAIQNLTPFTREMLKNPKNFFTLTPTEKGSVLRELANAGIDTGSIQDGKKQKLSATQSDDLIQAQIARDGIIALKDKLDELQRTGPVIGRLREANPFDPQVVAITAEINRIVPGLARGVFKEVGVLTDTDIDRYTRTLANPKATKQQIEQLHNDTMAKIDASLKTITSTYDDLGYDLGRFEVEDIIGSQETLNTGASGTTSSGLNYTIE